MRYYKEGKLFRSGKRGEKDSEIIKRLSSGGFMNPGYIRKNKEIIPTAKTVGLGKSYIKDNEDYTLKDRIFSYITNLAGF